MQLHHWEERGCGCVGDLTECYSDGFVGGSSDGHVIGWFVEMTGGTGVKEGSFDKLGGVGTFEPSLVFANVLVQA